MVGYTPTSNSAGPMLMGPTKCNILEGGLNEVLLPAASERPTESERLN